jgi:hypothetical protein
MGASSPVGIAVTTTHMSAERSSSVGRPFQGRLLVIALMVVLCAARAIAADTYALIVSGASGGAPYAEKYDGWRNSFVATLKTTLGYRDDRIVSLPEASRAQIQQVLRDLRGRMTKDDVLFVMLIGHGTDEKFNLTGPDMTAADWAAQLKPIPGRVVFVDTTSSSFPFLRQLAAPGRIVITATDSAAQQFETVFPEFFIKAFTEPSADGDKDGRISIFEAFLFASANVRIWFDRHNQLPTERALLDDDGDGVGREAWNPSPDGAVARATFLQPRAAAAGNPIAKRQADLENAIADLKARRSSMPAAAYDAELERLLTELALLMVK